MSDIPDLNPLLAPWPEPYGLPPFAAIRPAHYEPAVRAAMAEHLAELDELGANPAPPTFDNTVVAFDRAGALLRRIAPLFQNMVAAETSGDLQAVERVVAPLLAGHEAQVLQHPGVFARLDALFERRGSLGLEPEGLRLLERAHLDFCLAGARLPAQARQRALRIAEELAGLQTEFTQNVLSDESAFEIELTPADLQGLPDSIRSAARQAAAERGRPEGWIMTLSRSQVVPLLCASPQRDLRERVWRAWICRGQLDAKRDNAPVIRQILALRAELAQLHGHADFAAFALQDTMARNQKAVLDLLHRAWAPAVAKFDRDKAQLTAFATGQGAAAALAPWDWRYWSELLRAQRFDFDDAEVKPFFSLERMMEAMFDCAGRLFGLRFVEKTGVPLYHPDARLFEVRDAADALVGIFLSDNFARPTKRGGAWMNEYRCQSRVNGPVVPIVANHNNFSKPEPGQPCLLSLDDVRTLFHEFGHGLHGLLSNVTYERLAGTRVLRDFVELPSQLFEHWALQPEVLARHARHIQTGEPISPALVDRVLAARRFHQGLETVEYLSSALLDQALHGRTDLDLRDLDAFERQELGRLGMPAEVVPRHRLPHFLHLFSGPEYASAYYVYIWAEVLDADAFGAFVEAGDVFDPATARRLQRYVYGAGNTLEPGAAYRAFRGRDPDVAAMLAKRGLDAAPVA